MKRTFWTSDWFFVIVIAVVFALASNSATLQGLERTTYDIGVRSAKAAPGNKIAIIAIDDQSIENLGRWPWPRDIQAMMIDKLSEAGAKVIGLTLLMSEPQTDPGLVEIQQLNAFYQTSTLNPAPPETIEENQADDSLQNNLANNVEKNLEGNGDTTSTDVVEETEQDNVVDIHEQDLILLGQKLAEAEQRLNTDKILAASIEKAGNVVLPMQMIGGNPIGRPDKALPEPIRSQQVAQAGTAFIPVVATVQVSPPIEAFAQYADAIGHLVNFLDVDNGLRSEALILDYYGELYPSFALQVAARSLNLGPGDILISPKGVQLGNLSIGTDSSLFMNTFFYPKQGVNDAFPKDSFFDVLVGKIDPKKYQDKVVLIGATAFGLGSTLKTPLTEAVTPVDVSAHTIASILNEDFFTLPSWAGATSWVVFLLVVLYLILALPRLSAGLGAAISAVVLVGLVASEILLLGLHGTWLPLTFPAALLFTGHLALTTKKFLVTEQGKEKSEKESAESNRMLGLAFQQQGQLDMAFEKFRRVPITDDQSEDLLDLLYNLAMDFERKRQFNKASSVYQYIAKHNPEFKDIQQRTKRANDAQDTIIFGLKSTGGSPSDTLLGADGEFEKPMLGRYQVEKELGRGAMGIVYQGRDPKINRVVAIKTLSLAEEFEAEELEEIKERFFREAEAAGTLNHPNIVTVFDAGEEHDLAYIAMEFLKGHDLLRYTKPDALMDATQVLKIIASCAEALDYAHQHTIVHRDIKPANLMYDPDTKQVKITDFGIARVNNSSRTKTGMVVGTPSFMSPEQVTGKRVDGRSDIFSLGVVLYQMLVGDLPFQAENATQIMYQIATEPHPNILETRPSIKRTMPWVSVVLNRALEKDMDKRYQRGQQMANDLKQVLKKMAAQQQKNSQ